MTFGGPRPSRRKMCQAQPKAQLQVIVQVQTAPPSPPVPPPGAGGRCVRHRKPLAPALHTAKARNSRTARKPRGLIKWLPRASARHWGSNFSPGAGSTGALDPHHCQSTAPCSCRAHSETPPLAPGQTAHTCSPLGGKRSAPADMRPSESQDAVLPSAS